LRPIFCAHIVVNFSGDVRGVQSVTAVFSRAGNPVFLTSLHIVVIGLFSRTLEAPELLATIIDCCPCLGISHTPDPDRPGEISSLERRMARILAMLTF
jgi:hypothetical protein